MTKNIVLIVMVVIAFLSVVYAFVQQTAAAKAMIVAEQNFVLAQTAQSEADRQLAEAKVSRTAAEMAEVELIRYREELAKCQGKK